jgi:DNA polymerase, archaea type
MSKDTDEYWDLRIVSAAVKLEEEEKLTVELYGHTNDGKSIIVRDVIDNINDMPYFFIFTEAPGIREYLENRRDVLKVITDTLYYKGEVRDCLKVFVRSPRNIKYIREDMNIVGEFSAADIPFHLRYIYDKDLDACVRVYGKQVYRKDYTSEIIVEKERYEKIEPFNPKLKILSFDIENRVKDIFGAESEITNEEEIDDRFFNKQILTVCCVVQKGDEIIETGMFKGKEEDILENFSKFIRDNDPDVISGYNIEGYDLRVLHKRSTELKVELHWGRDGSILNGLKDPKFNKLNWSVNGRIIVDAWWAVKMDLKPKQESLNAVSMQLLGGEQKLNVDPRKMDEEWEKDPDHVMEYCKKDAVLSLKILNKLERIRKMMDLSTVSKMPLSEVNKNRSSLLIDSILIRAADRKGAAVPMSGTYKEDDEAIEGAYVHEMNPGLYQWVCVLDFKSMYPSMIISKNICFTTISEEGTIISPTGSKFLAKEDRVGILPEILSNLMNERDLIKKKMKEAKTEEEKKYYDGLQNAIKIYMNSFYGVFASSFYRFTDKHIGSSVTAFSRETTKGIIKDMEDNGLEVLYSDTDSIFVKSPYDELEAAKEFGFKMVDKYSKEGGILEFEKILRSMFSHGKKKRYVGKIIWPKEEMIIRGYEIRRTDSFDIQSETMQEVFDSILNGNIDTAMKMCRNNVKKVLKGDVEMKKLIISKGCKAFYTYAAPESQATVQTAKKMMALGYEFIPGMKVSWIVTNSKKTPQEVEPYIEGREFIAKPDFKYYAERMAQTLSRITEVYGITEKDLLAGNVQSRLFEEEDSSFKIKEAENKISIDDFM